MSSVAAAASFEVKYQAIRHNIKYYGEFYATIFGFIALQAVTYLLSYLAANQRKVASMLLIIFPF